MNIKEWLHSDIEVIDPNNNIFRTVLWVIVAGPILFFDWYFILPSIQQSINDGKVESIIFAIVSAFILNKFFLSYLIANITFDKKNKTLIFRRFFGRTVIPVKNIRSVHYKSWGYRWERCLFFSLTNGKVFKYLPFIWNKTTRDAIESTIGKISYRDHLGLFDFFYIPLSI